MNTQRLRGKIVENGKTLSAFAKDVLHITPASFSTKLHTGVFSQGQICRMVSALELSPEETYTIFFADDVAKYRSNSEKA